MLSSYNLAIIYTCGIFIFSLLFVFLPFFFAKNKIRVEKISPYECGVEPFSQFFQFFNVQYFLIAAMFLIFDMEIIFLLPWVVTVKAFVGVYGVLFFLPFYVFMLFLLVGYVIEWNQGVLNWTFGSVVN